MKIITRKQWGALEPESITPLFAYNISGIAVHYSAAYADELGDPYQRVRAIQKYHMGPGHDPTMPWSDIAYNFLFSRDGLIFEGRGWNKRSAAQGTKNGNDHFIAICFLGTDKDNRDDVTSQGRVALSDFINYAMWAQFKKPLEVQPHNFFHSTECPGDELRSYIQAKGWKHENKSGLPSWYWTWVQWRLGESKFKGYGKRNKNVKPTSIPKKIPYNVWVAYNKFLLNRKK